MNASVSSADSAFAEETQSGHILKFRF